MSQHQQEQVAEHKLNSAEVAQLIEKMSKVWVASIQDCPNWPTDPIHAVALLNERMGGLTRAVTCAVYRPQDSAAGEAQLVAMEEEALQIAAAAMRFLLSLPHYEYDPSELHTFISEDES